MQPTLRKINDVFELYSSHTLFQYIRNVTLFLPNDSSYDGRRNRCVNSRGYFVQNTHQHKLLLPCVHHVPQMAYHLHSTLHIMIRRCFTYDPLLRNLVLDAAAVIISTTENLFCEHLVCQ